MYTGYFEIPDDLDEMLKIKGILKRRGTFNPKLADMVSWIIVIVKLFLSIIIYIYKETVISLASSGYVADLVSRL